MADKKVRSRQTAPHRAQREFVRGELSPRSLFTCRRCKNPPREAKL